GSLIAFGFNSKKEKRPDIPNWIALWFKAAGGASWRAIPPGLSANGPVVNMEIIGTDRKNLSVLWLEKHEGVQARLVFQQMNDGTWKKPWVLTTGANMVSSFALARLGTSFTIVWREQLAEEGRRWFLRRAEITSGTLSKITNYPKSERFRNVKLCSGLNTIWMLVRKISPTGNVALIAGKVTAKNLDLQPVDREDKLLHAT
ncbi:MAG: hypothetical protein GY765_19170, partial [bacterium]|nr:hypothetical protein [bacterium]